MISENLAIQYLDKNNKTIDDYDGWCLELTDEIIHWLGSDRVSILSIVSLRGLRYFCPDKGFVIWKYHAAPIIDGCVHDAWNGDMILPPKKYLYNAFPSQPLLAKIYNGDSDPITIEI